MKENFKSPDKIYCGTDFWMLNDELTDDEIRLQIKEFHDKGMGGFIFRTYVGLRTDYPGPKWKHQVRVMLEESAKYGLRVTLQAMRMPGGFIDCPYDDILDIIKCVSKDFYESDKFPNKDYPRTEILKDMGDKYIVKMKSCAKPDEEGFHGGTLNMFSPEKCEYYVKLCYEDFWEEFREYYGNTIHTMWVDEPCFNQKAIPFPEGIEKIFEEKWGYKIEDNLESLFFKIGDYKKVRYQYRILLQRLMEKGYFKTLSEWFIKNNVKFSGHLFNEDALVTQIIGSMATMPYYKYLDIPGMDTLEADMEWRYGEIKPAYSREYLGYRELDGECSAPGGNMATPMATIGMYTTPLQVTSAAHQAGKEHILAEMFGVTTHNLTFRDQRHLFDHFASFGINHKSIHGFFYGLHGKSKRAFPHQVNYYQPYWENYSDMFNYFKRTSWFISQGKPIKDTLLIHPLDTAYMIHDPAIDQDFSENAELRDYERFYYGIVRGLCAAQNQFEFGDEATIGDWGKITKEGFEIGKMTYKSVVLPYLDVLRSTTAELLIEYAKCGGKVYILGNMPTRLDGVIDEGLGGRLLAAGCEYVETKKELLDILDEENSSYRLYCTSDATPIIINHRADEKMDYYFIMNDDCRDSREITLTVSGNKKATQYIAVSGTTEELNTTFIGDETEINITIPEGGSIMFTLEDAKVDNPSKEQTYFIRELKDSWNLTRHKQNVLLIEDCQYKKAEEKEFSEKTYPSIMVCGFLNKEDYLGDVYLRYTFISDKPRNLQLVLEDVDLCEAWLNGEKLDMTVKGTYFARAFEILDLPECKAGENEIIIKKAFKPANKMGNLESNQERVDIESIYIIGDFAVVSREEPVNNGTHRISRFFTLCDEQKTAGKDITSVGYPFYTGSMSFSQTIKISEEDMKKDKILFTYEEFNGCTAEIIVNGKSLGFVYWAPYEIDIKSALQVGDNEITVKITNCLRNLLGPYHRVKGENGHTWGYNATGSIYDNVAGPWGGNPYDPDWYNRREIDDNWWTADYFVLPFGLGKVKLKLF